MGFLDTFKGNQYKQEIDRLNFELQQLKSTFTPEMREAANIQALIQSLKIEANNTSMLIAQKKQKLIHSTVLSTHLMELYFKSRTKSCV